VSGFPLPVSSGLKAARWLVGNAKMKRWAESEYKRAAELLALQYPQEGDEEPRRTFIEAVDVAGGMKASIADRVKVAALEAAFPIAKSSQKFRHDLSTFSINFAGAARSKAGQLGYPVGNDADPDNTWATENLARKFTDQFVSVLAQGEGEDLDAKIRTRMIKELGLGGIERSKLVLRALTVPVSSSIGAFAERGVVHHNGSATVLAAVGTAAVTAGGVLAASRLIDSRGVTIQFGRALTALAVALSAPFHEPNIDYRVRDYERDPGRLAAWLEDICPGLPRQRGIGTEQMSTGPPAVINYTFDQTYNLQIAFNAFDRVVEDLTLDKWAYVVRLKRAVNEITGLFHMYHSGKPVDLTRRPASVETFVEAVEMCVLLARSLATSSQSSGPRSEDGSSLPVHREAA
jgi:hypothetical protein